jgi:hypothetical protein
MSRKNKGAKKRTSKAKGIEGVTGTKARKAATRQVRAKARELCKLGYNIIYYLRLACKV